MDQPRPSSGLEVLGLWSSEFWALIEIGTRRGLNRGPAHLGGFRRPAWSRLFFDAARLSLKAFDAMLGQGHLTLGPVRLEFQPKTLGFSTLQWHRAMMLLFEGFCVGEAGCRFDANDVTVLKGSGVFPKVDHRQGGLVE